MISVLAFLPRIVQDPAYHNFADQRVFLGVPNALNVISNFPFLVIGILGLVRAAAIENAEERTAIRVLFAGITAIALGSSWYHLAPSDETLFWDRLPMAVAFMALFSLIVAEGFNTRLGLWLWPMVAAGAASVILWRVTGDLTLYALVQFVPLVAIPAMLLLRPARCTRGADLLTAAGWYVLAKILELLDRQVFALGHVVSGHTLKHIAAALATACLLRYLMRRRTAGSWPARRWAAHAVHPRG